MENVYINIFECESCLLHEILPIKSFFSDYIFLCVKEDSLNLWNVPLRVFDTDKINAEFLC